MINLMLYLPQLMRTGQTATKILDGTATKADYDMVIDDVLMLAREIPQLRGILLLVEPAVRIAKAAIAEWLNDPTKAAILGITEEEMRQGAAVTELLGSVLDQMEAELKAAGAAVKPGDVDKLT